jgi:hypothetical protein
VRDQSSGTRSAARLGRTRRRVSIARAWTYRTRGLGRDGGERLPHPGIAPPIGELGHEGQRAIGFPALDGATVHSADLGDLDRDALEEALGLQGGVEDLGDVEEGPGLLEAPARLGVKGGVVDGDGGLAAERLEQAQILVVEGPVGSHRDGGPPTLLASISSMPRRR